MRKDLWLLVAGRASQALLSIAALRVLTALLSPAQVGCVFLALSLSAAFGLFLVNPVGMYVNRRLHEWHAGGTLLARLGEFNLYVAGTSALAFMTVAAAVRLFGLAAGVPAVPLAAAVAVYVYASTWNQTLVPALNMLEHRRQFVLLSVLTAACALALSWLLAAASPTALSWLWGQAAAMLALAGAALLSLRRLLAAEGRLRGGGGSLFTGLWPFAAPLAGATLFMWVQTQSYRVIAEKLAGAEFLGYLAVGLGISSSLAAVAESLVQQAYFPGFYKALQRGEAARVPATAGLASASLPAYVILAFFTVALAPQLTALLVDSRFSGAAAFVAAGAFVELFRMTGNTLAASAHAEMRTGRLIGPYAAGGVLTAAGAVAACRAGRAALVPAAMAAGNLLTAALLARGAAGGALAAADLRPAGKALLYSCPFLLLLPLDAGGAGRSAAVLAAAGAYFVLLQYRAAFKWRAEIPGDVPAPGAAGEPAVTVCMPAYNSGATIGASLASVQAQEYRNMRVIVADNASSDGTAALVRAAAEADPRVSLSVNPLNLGPEGNFTRCIELCGGEYTAIYHADDLYSPRMVPESVAFLERHPEAGAVFTAAREINSAGEVIGARGFPPELLRSGEGLLDYLSLLRAVLKYGNFLTFPSALVRTAVYRDEIRAWNGEKFKSSADLDVWLRIASRHRIGLLDRRLIDYRVSTASFSYTYARLRTARQDMFLVLDDHVAAHAAELPAGSLEDFRLLRLKDDISIAINLVIRGERGKALSRLYGIFHVRNIAMSLRSLTQIKFLTVGYAAFVAALLPLGAACRKTLSAVRHKG